MAKKTKQPERAKRTKNTGRKAKPKGKITKLFQISGRVINSETRLGVADLNIEAWHKDEPLDKLIGPPLRQMVKTTAEGHFHITATKEHFKQFSIPPRPDLFFKVYREDKLIKSTEDAVLIGVKSCIEGIIIEVDVTKAPTASFTVTPGAGEAPLEVRLDGSASSDPYCRITSYAWDFGDGNTETGAVPTTTHTYVNPGAFTVSLTVTNDQGVTNTASKAVTVIEPAVLAAPSGVTATAGDGQVVIRWDEVTGATYYNLYSSTSPGVSKQNGARIEGVTSPFTHGGLINGTTYFYVVTAVNEKGESAESNQVSAVPESAILAPPVDNTAATTLATATSFLYSGPNPIQIGVADGAIDPGRVSALRGQVLTPEGQPLSEVKVSVFNHPEFGSTFTRADGIFDMAVNGGGLLIVRYEKDDHFTARRQIMVPWQNYVGLPNVVMIPADEQVSPIDLNAAATVQVARGSQVSDDDGGRQATLMFSQGTTAEMVLPDGSTQALENLQVRATEYTIGPTGPAAMPAEMPANSGYTYAVEFTVDEAVAAGAQDVRFSRPLIHYVENFLNFPVGTIVPVGFYDRQKEAWIPSDNGRVIQILSVSNGLAELDLDGSGVAADAGALAQLDIIEAERQRLASLYQSGQSLWRAPITHFSPWDCNWPFGAPDDAVSPNQHDPEGDDREDDPCVGFGSLIECQNQVLGEMVDICGTSFNLHYCSDRVPGRLAAYTLEIPLSGANIPASLKRIDLEIFVAGQRFAESFPAAPNQRHSFTWDGKDAFGRTLQGAQPVRIRIGYVYDAVYLAPNQVELSFARFSASGVAIVGSRARQEFTLFQELTVAVGCLDARTKGLGGWSLNIHHAYDPTDQTLYLGDGKRRSARSLNIGQVITTVAGAGPIGDSGDGGPATEAKLLNPEGIAVGADGSLYISDSSSDRIRRVGPNGIITTIAGTGERGFSGDGGPAAGAQLRNPQKIALGPDGSLYIADSGNNRIRRVGPDGIITTVAGTGAQGFIGDEGPATQAALFSPQGIAVGPDGSLYIADSLNNRIRWVGPDGTITTVAGQEPTGVLGDGGPAILANLSGPRGVALGPDGSLYIADQLNGRIRRVGPDGIITTVAGTGSSLSSGDGGPATEAGVFGAADVAVGADGSLYIAETFGHRIRRVGPDGIITTVAGTGAEDFSGDEVPATKAQIGKPNGIAVGPDDTAYITDTPGGRIVDGVLLPPNARIRRLVSPLPASSGSAFQVASEDGLQVYAFDSTGRHLATLHALSGAPLYHFEYDVDGRLAVIRDGDDNITRIDRDGAGDPIAIEGPFGQRTTLRVDADRYLASITNPAGETTRFSYVNDGLLSTFTDPNGNIYRFTYDNMGRLIRDEDPAGGFKALSRTGADTSFEVELTTALGRKSTYLVERLSTGERRRVNTCACGAQTVMLQSTDGARTITHPDEMVAFQEEQPDPRFGMTAPLLEKATFETPGGLLATISATRAVSLSDPDNPLSLTNLTDTVDSNGRSVTTSFNANQKQITFSTPEGRQGIVTLDDQGRMLDVRTDGLAPITFAYDTRGRLTQVARGNQMFQRDYDPEGRLSVLSDADGNQFQFTYDIAGRLIQIIQPSGRIYRFSYDSNGNLTQITMPSGAAHTMEYTAINLGAGYTPPGNDSYEVSYNQDRQPTRVTLPGGRTVNSDYDSCGRLERESYTEARVDFTYGDSTERVSGITSTPIDGGQTQRIAFKYDGAVVTEMATNGAAGGQFSYRYDNNFLMIGVRLDDEPETTLVRDADDLLTGFGPFTVTREGPAGAPSQISDGILIYAFEYDNIGRIAARTYIVNGQQAYEAQFTYDNVGRIIRKSETVVGASAVYDYSYDKDGQLTEVKRDGAVVERYDYDANGNCATRQVGGNPPETANYDAQDRLLRQGPVTYQFNADGFLVQRGGDTFQYSARGELLEVTQSNGEKITYTYDGLGRRVARADTSRTYQYLYGNPDDHTQITAVRDTSGVLSEYYYDEAGLLFAIRSGDAFHYVATDQVGTPRVVCNAEGQAVKILEYDSFGALTVDSNPIFDLPIGFAGGLADNTTGLVRFGDRDYDPAAGRWTARDPIFFSGDQANLYMYVGNSPINLRDPDGRQPNVTDVLDWFLSRRPGVFDLYPKLHAAIQIYNYVKQQPISPLPSTGWGLAVGLTYARIYYSLFRRLSDCLATI